jgi:hypothetical protein
VKLYDDFSLERHRSITINIVPSKSVYLFNDKINDQML